MFLTDSGSGRCDVINDVIKFSHLNGYISATDRPIDFVFDPRVGFFGDGGSIGPTSGYIKSKMAAVDPDDVT